MLSRATFTAYIEGGVEDQRGGGMSFEECGITVDEKRDAATSPILKVMTEKIPLLYQQWLKATRLPPYFQIFFFIRYPV